MTRLRVGVDTGGTFTDVVVLDETTGALTTTKTPCVIEARMSSSDMSRFQP